MPQSPGEEQLYVLTVPEAGARLGLGRNASYEAAARGDIPTIRIGKLLRVPKVAFDRLLSGDWPAARSQSEQHK
jgi:excisionase family DNA binding protein